ncbi:MAG: hypothetical protein IMY72_02430 [Bacteroidetes bacterium]|nr:hypothetical protein [Bacteroidota bacterium]
MKKVKIFVLLVIALIVNSCSKEDESNPYFTYNNYENFIAKIAKNDSIIIVPLKDFDNTNDKNKIVLGLRHDIDVDINGAMTMSKIEKKYDVSASYYVLHTADYYLINSGDKSKHNEMILTYLQDLQNKYNHEVGIHNDLVTLQVVYNINSKEFLHNEINWLRTNGINIYGSASHGSDYCHKYLYYNFYFFKEYDNAIGDFINNKNVVVNNKQIPIIKGTLDEFDLKYEAYFLDNNKYYSDCSFINEERWNPIMIDYSKWKKGDKIIILTHPTHWY